MVGKQWLYLIVVRHVGKRLITCKVEVHFYIVDRLLEKFTVLNSDILAAVQQSGPVIAAQSMVC